MTARQHTQKVGPRASFVACPQCGGHGVVPLPIHLWDVVTSVNTGHNVSDAIANDLGISRTAACNRLKLLVAHGLLRREKSGKRYIYTIGNHS